MILTTYLGYYNLSVSNSRSEQVVSSPYSTQVKVWTSWAWVGRRAGTAASVVVVVAAVYPREGRSCVILSQCIFLSLSHRLGATVYITYYHIS